MNIAEAIKRAQNLRDLANKHRTRRGCVEVSTQALGGRVSRKFLWHDPPNKQGKFELSEYGIGVLASYSQVELIRGGSSPEYH